MATRFRPTQREPTAFTPLADVEESDDAYVVDNIPLPLENPWKRNVRLAVERVLGARDRIDDHIVG